MPGGAHRHRRSTVVPCVKIATVIEHDLSFGVRGYRLGAEDGCG